MEYGNTLTLQFATSGLAFGDEEASDVQPDTYSAQLETLTTSPSKICDLAVYAMDSYTYWVRFYASASVNSNIVSGKGYYVAFYWTKDNASMVERVKVIVDPDVESD